MMRPRCKDVATWGRPSRHYDRSAPVGTLPAPRGTAVIHSVHAGARQRLTCPHRNGRNDCSSSGSSERVCCSSRRRSLPSGKRGQQPARGSLDLEPAPSASRWPCSLRILPWSVSWPPLRSALPLCRHCGERRPCCSAAPAPGAGRPVIGEACGWRAVKARRAPLSRRSDRRRYD